MDELGLLRAIAISLAAILLYVAGMATIPLDLSAILRWPSARRWRAAKADTIWIAALPRFLWAEPRNVLPSKAITSTDTPISWQPRRRNGAGIPWHRGLRKCRRGGRAMASHRGTAGNRRHSVIFFWSNRAISTNASAPASTLRAGTPAVSY